MIQNLDLSTEVSLLDGRMMSTYCHPLFDIYVARIMNILVDDNHIMYMWFMYMWYTVLPEQKLDRRNGITSIAIDV